MGCPKGHVEGGIGRMTVPSKEILLLMIEVLQYLKDPKLWELWYIPYHG